MFESIIQILKRILFGLDEIFFLQILLAFILGSFVSFSLIISGQSWAKNFTNITTYSILPLIGLVITQTISGNIALSLGMVGALSIVRFRHPVKTPLELTIYFLLLTIGITVTSFPGKAIFLTIFTMLIIYLHSLYSAKRNGISKSFPNLAQIREHPEYILDIKSKEKDESISRSSFLLFSYENSESSIYNYKLAFGNKEDAEEFKMSINKNNNIIEIKFSCI